MKFRKLRRTISTVFSLIAMSIYPLEMAFEDVKEALEKNEEELKFRQAVLRKKEREIENFGKSEGENVN